MRSAKYILLTILFCSLRHLSAAGSLERVAFDSANAAYSRGQYEEAIKGYEKVLSSGLASSAIYYNLGNAYYKIHNTGKAILNYERAKKTGPVDEDIEANLKMALQKTEDRIDAAPEFFLSQWKRGVLGLMNERAWSLLCILLFAVALIFAGLYIFGSSTGIRKLGFFMGLSIFLFASGTFFVARTKYQLTVNSADAVITAGSVTVTGSPDLKGTKLFILHEGTLVNILQEEDGWMEIRIANGNVGWVKVNFLEKV